MAYDLRVMGGDDLKLITGNDTALLQLVDVEAGPGDDCPAEILSAAKKIMKAYSAEATPRGADTSIVTRFMPAYSGNYTRNRAAQAGGKIREITIHHAAGNTTIDALGRLWQTKGRNGSSHYGVHGKEIGQYVAESDIAWTNSSWGANCRAVTIETANSGGAPNWPVANNTLDTLILLVADIAKRNGLAPLVLGKNVTWHSMYAATACPGPYLFGKLQYVVDKANELIKEPVPPAPEIPAEGGLYRVQVGAFSSKLNAESYSRNLKAAGFDTYVTKGLLDQYYRVQVGAWQVKESAEAYALKVKAAGFAAIVKGGV